MTLRARLSLRRTAAAALALTLALSACSTGTDREDEASATPPASSAPGPLTIATSFTIDDLDPLENGFWGPEFGYVELLMRPERSGAPTPWVLEELANVDPLTWKLVLHEGVSFQNGRALDATALAELLQYTSEQNDAFAAASSFVSATPAGPLEVTLKTKLPTPGLPFLLADEANVPVYDVAAYKTYLESKATPEALLEAGLYTGPYVMDSLSPELAQLTPNPGYWNGTPGLSALTIKFVPEATARVQAVQAGEADLALYMPTVVAATLAGRDDAFYVTGRPAGTTFAFQLNNARAPFDDPLVRQAVYAAVDYRELAEDVLDGLADVATSVFGGEVPYAVDTQRTDLTKAAGLLDQAGFVASSDGTRKAGKQLTLKLLSYPQQPDSDTIAVALQSQLKKVGIEVTVSQVPDITEARESGDWDGAIVGDSLQSFSLSPVEGLDDLRSGFEENYQKVSNPALDALLVELRAEFDQTARDELLKQVQQIISQQGLWAATVQRKPAVVTNEAWKGYEPPISNLWVDARTAAP